MEEVRAAGAPEDLVGGGIGALPDSSQALSDPIEAVVELTLGQIDRNDVLVRKIDDFHSCAGEGLLSRQDDGGGRDIIIVLTRTMTCLVASNDGLSIRIGKYLIRGNNDVLAIDGKLK